MNGIAVTLPSAEGEKVIAEATGAAVLKKPGLIAMEVEMDRAMAPVKLDRCKV